jgi:hypothetical protein
VDWKGWPVNRADALIRAIGRDNPPLLIRYEGFRRRFVRRADVEARMLRVVAVTDASGQIVVGAQDAAKELGYDLVATCEPSAERRDDIRLRLRCEREEASVEFLVKQPDVARFGLTLRDYARREILDALPKPET